VHAQRRRAADAAVSIDDREEGIHDRARSDRDRRSVEPDWDDRLQRVLLFFVAAANHGGDEGWETGAEGTGTDAEILNERGTGRALFSLRDHFVRTATGTRPRS
jgi:hypothetical protein